MLTSRIPGGDDPRLAIIVLGSGVMKPQASLLRLLLLGCNHDGGGSMQGFEDGSSDWGRDADHVDDVVAWEIEHR